MRPTGSSATSIGDSDGTAEADPAKRPIRLNNGATTPGGRGHVGERRGLVSYITADPYRSAAHSSVSAVSAAHGWNDTFVSLDTDPPSTRGGDRPMHQSAVADRLRDDPAQRHRGTHAATGGTSARLKRLCYVRGPEGIIIEPAERIQ